MFHIDHLTILSAYREGWQSSGERRKRFGSRQAECVFSNFPNFAKLSIPAADRLTVQLGPL